MKPKDIIRALLNAHHMSQQELAERIGKQQTHISNYLGDHIMRFETFKQLCTVMGEEVPDIDIRALMQKQGVTYEELGKHLGITKSSAYILIKGNIRMDKLVSILAYLDTELEVAGYIVS